MNLVISSVDISGWKWETSTINPLQRIERFYLNWQAVDADLPLIERPVYESYFGAIWVKVNGKELGPFPVKNGKTNPDMYLRSYPLAVEMFHEIRRKGCERKFVIFTPPKNMV